MESYTIYQFVGLAAFLVMTVTAITLSTVFGRGYVPGLVMGFAVGLTVAVFQYGIIVETEVRAGGYRDAIKRKIDQVVE